MTVVEPARRFRGRLPGTGTDGGDRIRAALRSVRLRVLPKGPRRVAAGRDGRSVFPFNHHEQALLHRGRIEVHDGPLAGRSFDIAGPACRDHSWGWRDDLAFGSHHWVCASFDDRVAAASVMTEDFYPHGPKAGGWIATAEGVDPVASVDVSGSVPLGENGPLPASTAI